LYACTESKLEQNGSVSAFKIDTLSGEIDFINKQDAGCRNPVYLVVDESIEYVINSNYTDSGISIFRIKKGGSLKMMKYGS
jgi:6-phosphogluconolactonase (cycloisomerase 2 family)